MMSLEQLKEQIIALPEQLREALMQHVDAQLEVSRLEGQIEKLKAQLEGQEEEADDDSNEDEDVGLIKLETKIDKLKVKLDEAEYKAELEFRRENPKTTEGHVKAAVGDNQEVNRLRLEIIDAKEEARIKKVTLQRERRAAWEDRVQARRAARNRIEPESDELNALQESLERASSKAMMAEAEVEALRAKLDTYKLLVMLEGV
jgi:chromosome segregation ATPase